MTASTSLNHSQRSTFSMSFLGSFTNNLFEILCFLHVRSSFFTLLLITPTISTFFIFLKAGICQVFEIFPPPIIHTLIFYFIFIQLLY